MRSWGRVFDTNRMMRSEVRQRSIGDFIIAPDAAPAWCQEVKTEQVHTGNLFLESWSNRTPDDAYRRQGWMETLDADRILFVFLDQSRAYQLDFPALQKWMRYEMEYRRCQCRQSGMSERGEQRNSTWGYCAPLCYLAEFPHLNLTAYQLVAGIWQPADVPQRAEKTNGKHNGPALFSEEPFDQSDALAALKR